MKSGQMIEHLPARCQKQRLQFLHLLIQICLKQLLPIHYGYPTLLSLKLVKNSVFQFHYSDRHFLVAMVETSYLRSLCFHQPSRHL